MLQRRCSLFDLKYGISHDQLNNVCTFSLQIKLSANTFEIISRDQMNDELSIQHHRDLQVCSNRSCVSRISTVSLEKVIMSHIHLKQKLCCEQLFSNEAVCSTETDYVVFVVLSTKLVSQHCSLNTRNRISRDKDMLLFRKKKIEVTFSTLSSDMG